MKRNIVVALTGASGASYAVRLIETLLAAECDVHLVISDAGKIVLEQELGLHVDFDDFRPEALNLDIAPTLRDPKLRALRGDAPSGLLCPFTVRTIGLPRWPAVRFLPTAWSSARAPATRSAQSPMD